MTIGYIHIRPGQTYSKEDGLTGTPEAKGGTTIAYTTFDYEGTPHIRFGIAHCSSKDSYDRKRGRIVAKGRLFKDVTQWVIPAEAEKTAPTSIIEFLTECENL